MTAVAGLDLDAETRSSMLTSASEESVRASAELAAIGALAACALDNSDVDQCDLNITLREAADIARLTGIDIDVAETGAAVAPARPERVRVVFPALLRLVAGAGRHVRATTVVDGGEVRVRIERYGDDADAEPLPPVVDHLVAELGAGRVADDGALTLSFGVAG